MKLEWTLFDLIRDPQKVYREMRQRGPLHWSDEYHVWFVVDYEIARELLRHPDISSDTVSYLEQTTFPKRSRKKIKPLIDLLHSWIIFSDPPYHTIIRKILNPLFDKHAVEAMESQIKNHVIRLLSDCDVEWEAMQQFCRPLSACIMADLLELPHQDIPLFIEWNLEIASFMESVVRTPHLTQTALTALKEQQHYLQKAIDQSKPGSFLKHLSDHLQQEKSMPHDAIWRLVSMLMGTGMETTQNLIGNGLYLLLSHPQQWQRLKENPTLMDTAVDECLRFETPVQSMIRLAKQEIHLGNVTIKPGQYIRIFNGAVNHDPQHFKNPEIFDIAREPNKHLAFGAGIHFCIGRLLAKLAAKIAFSTIIEVCPNVFLQKQNIEWEGGVTLRGLKTLFVEVM